MLDERLAGLPPLTGSREAGLNDGRRTNRFPSNVNQMRAAFAAAAADDALDAMDEDMGEAPTGPSAASGEQEKREMRKAENWQRRAGRDVKELRSYLLQVHPAECRAEVTAAVEKLLSGYTERMLAEFCAGAQQCDNPACTDRSCGAELRAGPLLNVWTEHGRADSIQFPAPFCKSCGSKFDAAGLDVALGYFPKTPEQPNDIFSTRLLLQAQYAQLSGMTCTGGLCLFWFGVP
ncbi:MAG: hypothetical protein VKM97_04275 [Cyanobacteriota bacterium]|nr:hypothetical protein [Cyanobacteriota bacterium]